MNCAEVMEWMHRYLDHDLSQDEMIEMFRHIDDCPSCADIFDRLTMLSQQLEHLPDVKAPFSLVDSILPQLDELDRGSREQSGASSAEQGMIPFSRKSPRGKLTKGNSIASRTGIGAAAAAVILIIALFNMPDKMPGAEVEQLTSAVNSADSGEATRKMDTESTNTADEANMNGAADSAMGASSAEQSPVPAVEDDTSPAATAGSGTPAVTPGARVGAVPTKTEEPVSEKIASPTMQTPKSTSANPQATDANALNSTEANPNKSEPTTGNNDAADASVPLQETMKVPADPSGIMSMLPNLVASQPLWTSPDGRYAAELAGQQLVIYSIPPNESEEGKLAVTSYPLIGTWVSGEWSPDSLQFTYVTEQAGAEVTKVYTVQAEVDATSSSAPTVTPASTSSDTSSTK